MTLALHYALRSDVGLLREGNEDSRLRRPALAGDRRRHGRSRGRRGSQRRRDLRYRATGPPGPARDSDDMLDALAAAVASARNTLHDMSVADPAVEGMGTTLTALLWAGAQVAVCHIGDSRAYLLRDGDLYQITRDHTLIQSLVDEGRLSPARGRQPPAAIADHAGAAGQHRRGPGPGHARGAARRPVPVVLGRPDRRCPGRGRARRC